MPRPFPEERRLEWKEIVRRQQESGQSVNMARWCREQQINYDSFLYWKKRFETVSPINRSSFKELPEPSRAVGITIEYQKIQIHLTKDFDPVVLTKCLRVLKGAIC